jgi:hypothetical protein
MADPKEMFDQAGGGQFDPSEMNGSLLVIWPTALEEDVPTTYGDADAIRANILVVDGEHAGEYIDDALIFPRVLVSSLRSKVGRQVLGRLGQGQAKPKQDPPWILQPFDDDDATAAIAAVQAWKSGQFSAADEPEAAPAAKKEAALTAQQKALAETLSKSNVPAEAIAEATGATLAQLADAGIIELA